MALFTCCKKEPAIKGNYIVENLCNEEIVVRSVVSKQIGNNPPTEVEITDYISSQQSLLLRSINDIGKEKDAEIFKVFKELEIKKQGVITIKNVMEDSMWEKKEKSENEVDFILKVDTTFF